MNKVKAFLKRKDIEISARRYGIDADVIFAEFPGKRLCQAVDGKL